MRPFRPAAGTTGPFVPLLFAALLLCALSAAIQVAPNRYQAEPGPPAFDSVADLGRWHRSGTGAGLAGEQPVVVRLAARGHGRLVYAYRTVTGADRYSHVRVSAEVRGDDLADGHIAGGAAQVVALSLGRDHQHVPHWPMRLSGFNGRRDWQRVSLVIPTAERVRALQVVAFVAAESGWMEIRDPGLEVVREQPVFTLARYLVKLGWLVLAGLLLRRLLRRGARRLPRVLFAVAGSLAVMLAVAPPPLVERSAKRLLMSGQDLLYDLASLLPGEQVPATAVTERPAAADEPGTTETPAEDTATAAGQAEDGGKVRQEGDEQAGEEAGTGEPAGTAEEDDTGRQYWMPPRENLDKRVHLFGFAGLALIGAFAFRPLSPWRVLPGLAALALSVETLQGFTVMREPSALDFAADLLGALAGVLLATSLAWLARRWRERLALGL